MSAGPRAIACVVALTLSSGCATRGSSIVAVVGGAGMIFGGVVIEAAIAGADEPHPYYDGPAARPDGLGIAIALGGLVLAIVGLASLSKVPAVD